jgi:hypothetical protein
MSAKRGRALLWVAIAHRRAARGLGAVVAFNVHAGLRDA